MNHLIELQISQYLFDFSHRTRKNKKKHLAVKSSLNRMNSAPPDNSKSSQMIFYTHVHVVQCHYEYL